MVALTPPCHPALPPLLCSQLRQATQDCGLWRREFDREFGEAGPLQASAPAAAAFEIVAPRTLRSSRGPCENGGAQRTAPHACCTVTLDTLHCCCAAGGSRRARRRLEAPGCCAPRRAQRGRPLAPALLTLVGVALIAEGYEVHLPKGYLYFAMAFSFVVEMINIRMRTRSAKPVDLHGPEMPKEG